jgi:D-arabinose 1-dehydrogenase-like Zn-dependent alcohol dehydrogenase
MSIITGWTRVFEKFLSPFPKIIELYGLYYNKVVKNEIELGNITCRDRVLCIGGGSLPCTAIKIARQTGAKVYVIDNDPAAVKAADKVIRGLNLHNKIKIIFSDGSEVDPKDFTVVHIALQVFPKDIILKHILRKAREGTKILMRIPKEGLKNSYSNVSVNFSSTSLQYTEQKGTTMKATVLFIKEEGKKSEEKASAFYNRDSSVNVTSMVV